jgi:chromosome partitioning protein
MSMRRVAFMSEKGGTCKTTLAVNTAAYFAQKKGARVLLIDLDTQGHAGKSLGIDVRTVKTNVFHWLTDASVTLDDVLQPTAVPNLSVLPAYKEMADFPIQVANDPRRAYRLTERLEKVHPRFDVVMFDAPPSLGVVTTNILVATTEVVIPVATTYLALDGCAEMVATMEKAAKEHQRGDLRVSLVVPTLYRKTALADEILAKLRHYFPDRCAEPLAMNVAIDEAQSHGKTIWDHAPWSRGATLLQTIADDLWSRGRAEDAEMPKSA